MTRSNLPFQLCPRQRGLSLIELMIAMALGLVIILGVTQVFVGSSQTYRLSDSLGKLQENSRFSMGTIQRDARMAGHYGCLIGGPANMLNVTNADYDEVIYTGSIMGWEANDTGLGKEFTITTVAAGGGNWSNGSGNGVPDAIDGDMLPGTDFVLINGGELTDIRLTNGVQSEVEELGTMASTSMADGTVMLVVAGDCSGADLFQNGSDVSDSDLNKDETAGSSNPGNKAGNFAGSYDEHARLYRYTSTAYYIGEGVSGEPALIRERLDAGGAGMGAVELAEGVENMQVLYGVAAGTQQRVGSYVTAASVGNWDNVISVRIAMLLRSGDRVVDTQETRTVNLVGTKVTSESDRRTRLVSISTIGIRNRLE